MSAIGFYLFYVFIWVIALLPFKMLYIISDFLYRLVYYIIGYRKKTVFSNLKNSFPGKTDKEIRKIAKKFYKHFTDVIVEILKMIHLNHAKLSKHISYKNLELFDKYFKENKHVVLAIGHYGNWEWNVHLAGKIPQYHSLTIYKPLKDKRFDRFMYNLRSKMGLEVVPMKDTYRKLMDYNKKGVLTATGFIADQAPPAKDIQFWMPFLNQDTPVFLGIEKVAKKLDAAVVFFKVNKIRRGYYEMEAIELFDNVKDTDQYEITVKHVKALEETIKEQPAYWLWSHKRWKRKRNNN